MTPEERKEYMKKYNAEHKEEHRERMKKYKAEHKEERREYMKKYHVEHRARIRKYRSESLNKKGVTKSHVRKRSDHILEKCHAKLPGYQIHHCFGYEDPKKFIYIPKALHLQIHKLLKDNHISADSDHWNIIRELVNSCEEYTYIKA
jgi:hypothetical protein